MADNTSNQNITLVTPEEGVTRIIEITPGAQLTFNFDPKVVEYELTDDGDLLLTFKNGGGYTFRGFAELEGDINVSVDGYVVSMSELLLNIADIETAAGEGKALTSGQQGFEEGFGDTLDGINNLTLQGENLTNVNGDVSSDIPDLTVDTTLPDIDPVDVTPPEIDPVDLITPSDSGTFNDDNLTNISNPVFTGSAEPFSIITLFANGALLGTTLAGGDGSWEFESPTLDEGTYDITATATDASGNTSEPTPPLSVEIDLTTPATPDITFADNQDEIAAYINAEEVTGDGTPTTTTVNVLVPDSARAGDTLVITYNDINGAEQTVSAVLTNAQVLGGVNIEVEAIGEFELNVTAQAFDPAGNQGGTTTSSILIDTIPPDAPDINLQVDSRFEDDNYTNDGVLTFTGEPDSVLQFTVVDDMGNTIATPAETSMVNGEFTFDMDSLPDGTYTVVATLTDAAGNTSAPQTFSYTLDQTNPDLVTINESLPEISEDVPFNPSLGLFVEQLQASEPNVTYEIVGGNDNNWFTLTPDGKLTVTEAGINAGVMNFEQTGLGDGRTISIQTTDLAGNTNIDEYTLNVTNVNERPDAADFSYTNTVAGSTGLQANFYAFDNQTDLPTGINWTHQNAFDYVEAHISNSDTPADAAFIATQLDFGLKSGTLDTFSELSNFIAGSGTDLVDTRPDDNFDTYADRGIIKLEGSAFFEGGEHRIRVYSDDGFQLKVDGEVVASFYNDRAPGTTTVNIGDLTEGYHDLEIIYWDQGGRYVLKVEDSVRPDGGTWSTFGVIGNSPGSPDTLVHNPLETAEDNQLTIDVDLLLGQATDPDQGTTLNLVDSSLELHAMVNGLAVVGIGIVPPITDNGVTYTNEIVGVGQIGTDTSGNIVFTPAENYNGEVSFTYQVQDDGTPQLTSDPATVTLNVTPVNDTPTATDTASYDEGVEDQALVITRADLLEDLNIQDVEDGQNVILDITSTNSNIQRITYNQNTEEFTIIPKENFNGDAKLRVTIEDQDGATTYRAINANFDPANDIPTAELTAEFDTGIEDQTLYITRADLISSLNIEDVEDGQNVDLDMTTTNPNIQSITYDAINEQFVIEPVENFNGDVQFNLSITDQDGASIQRTIGANFDPVNDIPTAELTTEFDTGVEDQTLYITRAELISNLNIADVEDGQNVDLDLTTTNPNIQSITYDAMSEQYVITPIENFNGDVQFNLSITDQEGASIQRTISANFDPRNDAPTGNDALIGTIEEDATVPVTFTAASIISDMNFNDIDGDSLTLTYTPTPAQLGVVTYQGGGGLTVILQSGDEIDENTTYSFVPATNDDTDFVFDVTATDPSGAAVTQTATIDVLPVNDAPTLVINPVTIPEDIPTDTVIAQAVANDIDSNNLTFSFADDSLEKNGFVIDPNTGEIKVAAGGPFNDAGEPFDIDAPNTSDTITLDIKVDDNDGATTTQQLVVSITDINDNPVVFDPAQNNDGTPAPNYIFTMDETEGVVGTITAQDADLTAGDITYSLENTDGSPLNGFVIDQNGNITVTDPSAVELDPDGLNEFQSFVVRAQSEDGSENTQSVQLTVQPVNEHLLDFTDSTIQPVVIEETVNPEDGSRVVTQVEATDFDYTENVTYQLLNHTDKFEIDPQTGEITVKQGIVLDNVGTPDFDPLGSAYESNGIYTLTEPSMQENGAIWSTQKLDLTQDFTITAELYFGVARGGDGITFMLHPDIVDPATTSAGANLGANVDNAVVVEFDTYSDRSQGDPGFDHIAIHTDGNLTHESGPSSPVQLYNIEDSEWHEAVFTWDATNQVFTVSFEGRTATLSGDITQHLANNTEVFFGFTGATGNAFNLQQVNIISVDGIDAVFDLQVQATSADSNPTTPDEVITTTIPVTITASPDVNVNAIAFDAMKNSDDSPAENFNFTINEMSTVVGTITATDKDYRPGDITYSLENADGSPLNGFAIDKNGNISVTNPSAVELDPDGLNEFQTFVVRAQSKDGSESAHTVQLTVEPINEHAVNFTDSTIQPVIIEGTVNQEDGSRVVTQVEAKDFDYTENVTYELISHTDKFEINSQTGEITVKEGAILDNEGSTTFNALGTAYESNGIYTLTDPARSQDGAIWSDQTLDLTKDFSITADLFLGSSNGADGITFMLHPDSVDPADTALGGSLGANVENAVVVEFDTYRNSNLQDPWQDHISIHTDGDLRHGSDYSQAIQTSNLEDGLWHEATFAWNATTEVFTVSFEGKTATLTGGLSQHLANSTNVHFGFTGTTGGLYNLQQVNIKSVEGVDTTYDLEVQATSADTDAETPSEVVTTTIPVTITSVDMEDIALLDSPTTGTVAIQGTVEVGSILAADVSNLVDPDGDVVVNYQWFRGEGDDKVAIDGATRSDYTLTAADANHQITVEVNAPDADGTPQIFSDYTTYVAANPEFQGFTQSHELLLNGDFEDGAAHWTNDFGHVELQQIGSGIWGGSNDTGNGDKFVELSANNVSKNNLKQTVTVDQNSESVTLKFDYKARADDLGTQQFSVYLGTVLIAEDIVSGNEWQTFEITVPVSQLGLDSSGELTVEFYEDTNMTTGVMLDDISLAENLQIPSSAIHIDNDITPDGVIASLVNFDENSTYTLTNTDGSASEDFMVNESGQITPLVAEVDLPSGLTELNLTIDDGEGNSSTSNVFVTKDTIDDIIYSSSDDLSGGPIILDGNAINDVTGENDATDRFHIEGNEDVLIINFDATQGDTLDISSVLGGGAERMDLSASNIEQYVDISGDDGNFTITVKPEVPEAPEQIITIQDASGLDDQAALIQMLLQNN